MVQIQKLYLKKKGYVIHPTSRSSEFKKIGGWIISTQTKEGRDFIRDFENIPTVSSSEFGPGHYSVDGKVYKGKPPKGRLVSREGGIKFSKSKSTDCNEMLERTKGVGADKVYSEALARKIGMNKGRFEFFIPPSAEDFKGLIYRFLGKGKQGEADLAWFKENLFDPFAKGIRAYDMYRESMSSEWRELKNKIPSVSKMLNKNVPGSNFTYDTAIRVYLWNKSGFDIPGISNTEERNLTRFVKNNSDLKAFADALSVISRRPDGYIEPSNNWVVETTATDLNNITSKVGRREFLQDWIDNKDEIFSTERRLLINHSIGKISL